jgi:hypothetical protein
MYIGVRRITTFCQTRTAYMVVVSEYYNTYHCITAAYSIQYSDMLYRFVA